MPSSQIDDFFYKKQTEKIEVVATPGGLTGLPQSLNSLGIPSDKQFMSRYCTNAGLSEEAVAEVWYYYLSLAFFRIAAILQGVYKRSLSNQASGKSASSAGSLAKSCADISWFLAQKHEDHQRQKQVWSKDQWFFLCAPALNLTALA